jgi:hypothetical protein
MERLIASQQERIAAQDELIARLYASPATPHTLPLPEAPTLSAPAAPEPVPATMGTDQPTRRPSRRALLQLGGAAAAAGVAAAATAGIAVNGAAQAHADTIGFYQNISGLGNTAIKADGTSGAVGVEGTTDTGYGLYGLAVGTNAVAVYANSTGAGGTGVLGTGTQTGVYGSSVNGYGVSGLSISTTGVLGNGAYGGYFIGTTASLVVGKNASLIGPPNTGNHQKGELVTDANGLLFFCMDDGNPGTWVRLPGVLVGYSGGAIAYLPAPIRIFDTRPGSPAPLPITKGVLAGGSTTTIQVTGTNVGGFQVPPGATGVIGNLTVTGTLGGGDLILYPSNASLPTVSNINYVGGQTIANFASVGLSSGGAMNLFVHVSGTQAIFDVTGYVF